MNQKSILRILLISTALVGAAALARAEAAFDEAPVPTLAAPPVLSEELRKQNLSGLVSIKITIDEKGNVAEAIVAKSTNPQLEQAALTAVSQWKFRPAQKAGQPVAARVVLPIRFNVRS